MAFDHLEFFLVALAVTVPVAAAGLAGRRLFPFGLAASLVLGAYIFYPFPLQGVHYLLFILWQGLVVNWYARIRQWGKRRGRFWAAVAFSAAPMLCAKLAGWFEPLGVFHFLGVSYATFRSLQVLVETRHGLVTGVRPLRFLYFLSFAPALCMGPIDRSRRFEGDLDARWTREEYASMLALGLRRILAGAVCYFVIYRELYPLDEAWLVAWRDQAASFGLGHRLGFHLLRGGLYGVTLFFEFAGICSMAIGLSHAWGIRMPENFRRPFAAVDIKEFWDRWHITLSHWLRDFLFTPILLELRPRGLLRAGHLDAMAAYLATFLAMGLWHGFSLGCAAYGLYHGALLCAFHFYQKKSGFYRRNKGKAWYKALSWLATMAALAVAFALFRHIVARPAPGAWR